MLTQSTCGAVIGMVNSKKIATAMTSACATLVGNREKHGLLDIVVDRTALLYRSRDRGEVVVGQDHPGGFLGNLGALDSASQRQCRPS